MHTFSYEHWAWDYMEHYILCASIFMCIALHLARQAALVRRDPTNLNFCLLTCSNQGAKGIWPINLNFTLLTCSNQGAKGIGPTICAYSFSVCRFRFVRYVLSVYVGLGPKLHTCILFPVYVHYIFMNATSYTRYYLFSVQVNQYVFT